jgi:iron complex outermembrane receptor protein
VTVSLPGSGQAAALQRRFQIAPQPAAEALIAFAIQADISIGGVSSCLGTSPGLSGLHTVREGLQRLTAGACRFEILDSRTVRIMPLSRRAAILAPAASAGFAKIPDIHPAAPPVSEVLITATKRVDLADRVPASVSVIGAEQLQTTGAIDAAGTVSQVAGVTITNLGAGRDKILLRGLSDGTFTGRTRSTVGTYLDNAPITYNAPDPDLRLADVQAVEIVRGPQGALYGAGSLAGVYRIVTRQPRLGTFEGAVTGLYAWTDSGSPSQQLEGMVNFPLFGDRAAARLVGYYEVQGGYLDDVNLRLSNVDKTTREGGRLAIRGDVNDNWTVTLSSALQHLDSNDTQYVTTLKGLRRANRAHETHSNDFVESALTVEGSVGWGHLQSSTAYVRHDFASQFDATAALSLFGESALDFGIYREAAKIDMLSQDTVLSSVSSGPLRWLVGAYGALTLEKTPSVLFTHPSNIPTLRAVYTEHRSDRLANLALYGEASYLLAPGWTATVGARASRIDLRTSSNVVLAPPQNARSFVKTAEYSHISPKASLQYEFSSGDLVYLLASEGSRPGGFNSGGISRPSPSLTVFRPDQLKNLEIGTKLRFFDHRLEVRGALFYDVWTDIQTDQYLGSGLAFTANVGDGSNAGFEIEAAWRPAPRWNIQANALFDAPKLTRLQINNLVANRATGLPGVPDFSFGALTSYEHPLKGDRSVLLAAEIAYIGRSRITFDPTVAPEMGGYFTGRVSAQYRTPRWRLVAAVDNPTNSQGDTFAYGNPFSFGQVRQVTPQRPRTLSLAITRTF